MRGLLMVFVFALACSACGGSRRPVPVAPPAPAPRPQASTPAREPEPRLQPERAPAQRTATDKPSPLRDQPRRIRDSSTPVGVDDFEERTYQALGGRLLYRLFRPANYDPARKYPLILVLHGASSRGTDNLKQLADSNGPKYWASAEVQDLQQAFVVAPQSDPKYAPTWVRAWRPPARPDPKRPEPLELAVSLVRDLGREFSLDDDRLYLVGNSMGGFGAWIGASRHAELFAAAVPIAGGGDPTHIIRTKAKVWAFHGATDRVVPVRRSRQMVEALKKAGVEVRYTEYLGVGHEAWKLVYAEAELPKWLFKQSR
jgi:predicted peptidase